jgi:hypothetical protein
MSEKEDILRRGRLAAKATEVNEFTSSIPADRWLFSADLLVDRAHTVMLAKQGIIAKADAAAILKALEAIGKEGVDAVDPDLVILLGGKNNENNLLGYNTFVEGISAHAAMHEFVAHIHLLKLGGQLLQTLRRQQIDTPVEGPDNAPLFFHVAEARLCFERGEAAKAASDLPGAVAWYRKAWRLESSCVLPCKPLGELCEILGRAREAEVWYKRYVAADGSDAGVLERLSRVSYALHPRKFDEWRAYEINRIIRACAERGKRLLLVSYPEDDYGCAALARAHGLPFVDQRASFVALLQSEPRNVYFAADDSHCNAAGYGVMARNVADRIVELGWLRDGEYDRKSP